MDQSKKIAGLVGPTMMAVTLAESPFVQPHLYDAQIPPLVYLSGVLFFVAGLAIVRAHNRWTRDWTVLLTLSGWGALVLGAVRMFAAESYRQRAAETGVTFFVVVEALLFLIGLVLTVKAYSRAPS